MGSKSFLLLGLAFAIVVLISSEAAARDLAEASKDQAHEVAAAGVDQYGGGGGRYGGGGGHYGGGGGGGHYGGGGGGGHYGGGGGRCGYCRYGCCRYGCCHKAGEAAAEVQPDHN